MTKTPKENPERDERLQKACEELHAKFGAKFKVESLAAAAKVSNTIAGPARMQFLNKIRKKGRSAAVRDDGRRPHESGTDAPTTDWTRIVFNSQEQVNKLIDVVTNLVRSRTEDNTRSGPLHLEVSAADPAPRPYTSDSSTLSGRPGAGKPGGGHDEFKGRLLPAASDATTKPARNPLAAAENSASGALVPHRQPRNDRSASTVLWRKTDAQSCARAAKRERVIQAAIELLRHERGPLCGHHVHQKLPAEAQALYSAGYLKTILLTACPERLYHDDDHEEFWANEEQNGAAAPSPVCKAAVREAIRILARFPEAIGSAELLAIFPPQLRSLISETALSSIMERQLGVTTGLRRTRMSKWCLPGAGNGSSIDDIGPRPAERLSDLKKHAERIVAESRYSMTAAEIWKKLPEDVRAVFGSKKISKYLRKVAGNLVATGNRFHLGMADPGAPPKPVRVKSDRGVDMSGNKAAIDTAIAHLEATGRIMNLDDLHKETACPLDRDSFRKRMNQRRKTDPCLYRVGIGVYSFKRATR